MDNKSSMSANGFVEDADINILEKYYNTMNVFKGVESKQIKLQPKSYSGVTKTYYNILARKLERKKEQFMENADSIVLDQNGLLSNETFEQIDNDALKIAKEEANIMYSDRPEKVSKWVQAKAMELKRAAIAVIIDNYKNNMPKQTSDSLNIMPSDETSEEIKNAVNTGFSEVQANPTASIDQVVNQVSGSYGVGVGQSTSQALPISFGSEGVISRSEIESVLNDKLLKTEKEIPDNASEGMEREQIEAVINDSLGNAASTDSELVTREDVEKTIEDAMSGVGSIDQVSKMGTAAKIGIYDKDGNPLNGSSTTDDKDRMVYNYTPMTDEEIMQAREEIDFDKYEREYRQEIEESRIIDSPVMFPAISVDKVFVPQTNTTVTDSAIKPEVQYSSVVEATPLRGEETIVVPERDASSYFKDVSDIAVPKNIGFDFEDATPNDMFKAIDNPTISTEDAKNMRRRAEELLKRQSELRKLAEEKAAQVNEIQAKDSEVTNLLQDTYEKMALYTDALSQDLNYYEKQIGELDREYDTTSQNLEAKVEAINEMNSVFDTSGIDLEKPRGK
ncbi:MAG: hypothetical protein HFJ11_04840 [Bacilli bacterium]|nr:hypothetical protein [Bacilli bacterium]